MILLGATYLVALILLTGQPPVGFVKVCSRMIARPHRKVPRTP